MALASSVWFYFSDIPWTHFVAAALLGGIVLVSVSGARLDIRAALVGALAITLVQTRLFEAMVAAIAAVMIAPVALVRYRRQLRQWPAAMRGIVLPGLAGAFAAIGALSHNWSLYQQYAGQDGLVLTPELLPAAA